MTDWTPGPPLPWPDLAPALTALGLPFRDNEKGGVVIGGQAGDYLHAWPHAESGTVFTRFGGNDPVPILTKLAERFGVVFTDDLLCEQIRADGWHWLPDKPVEDLGGSGLI